MPLCRSMPKMESRLRFWHQEETQDKTIFSNAFAAMLRVCPLRRARINWRVGRGVFNVSLAISPDFSAGRAKASGKKATPKSCLTNGRIWSDVAASISGENVSPSAANKSRAKA